MKAAIIFTSLFVIVSFAAIANAQHIKVFDGRGNYNLLSPSRTAELPPLDVNAGKPIKAEIHFLQVDKTVETELRRNPPTVYTDPIPCGFGVGSAYRNSNGKFEVYLEFELSNTLVSSYSISGRRGTCRLLTVLMPDGTEQYGKLRFR